MFLLCLAAAPITLKPGESITITAATQPALGVIVATQPSTAPATQPIGKRTMSIGPGNLAGSMDDVDLNATADITYTIAGNVACTRMQVITQPGVELIGQGTPKPVINFSGGVKGQTAAQIIVKAAGFRLENVTVRGDASATFVRPVGCDSPAFVNVSGDGTGIFIIEGGSKNALVDSCDTPRQGRYAGYFAGTDNNGVIVRNCRFGPSDLEHSMRCYGLKNALFENCVFDNTASPVGKQGLKIHSGSNVTIRNCTINGANLAARFGRDANDPTTNTLTGLVITNCKFNDSIKVDPGAKLAINNSTISGRHSGFVISVQQDSRLSITGLIATYGGGAFANNPGKIAFNGVNTFNGRAVTK